MHASTVGEGVPRGISPHVAARHTHLNVEHLALAGVSDAEEARASIPPTINRRMVSSSSLDYGARIGPANGIVPRNGQKVRSDDHGKASADGNRQGARYRPGER